jgi:hypothetical protein
MKEHADWLPAFADPEIRPRVTPFAGKDIDWLLRNDAGDRLMFASDYPHYEGTDDPIARHEQTPGGGRRDPAREPSQPQLRGLFSGP